MNPHLRLFRPVPAALRVDFCGRGRQVGFVGFEVRAICLGGSHSGYPSADFASCAQRPASAFGALVLCANNVLTLFLLCVAAPSNFVGDGASTSRKSHTNACQNAYKQCAAPVVGADHVSARNLCTLAASPVPSPLGRGVADRKRSASDEAAHERGAGMNNHAHQRSTTP